MTYFPEIGIFGADSPSADAFARFRVSEPYTIFDSKLIFSSSSLLWDSSASNSAFFEYSQSQACLYLKTPAVANSRAIRQTKEWFNYQPGKSQLIVMTSLLNPQPGVIKRVGYFEDNNGIFFETSGSSIYVVKRSNSTGVVVDTKVSQSAWNLDTMDGTGKSNIDLDFTKAHIFFMDLEWLGVGRVRTGFFYDGIPHYSHQWGHGNELTNVYMKTPNLPLRYEIINKAGTAPSTLKQICASVVSEGGLDPNGVTRTVDTAGDVRSINQNVTGSLIALRLKPTWIGSEIILNSVEVFTSDANINTRWTVAYNPSGSGAFTWQDIPNSPLQRATNVSAVNIKVNNSFPNAVTVGSGYFATTTQAKQIVFASVDSILKLGRKINGTMDVLVLAACPLNGAATYRGAITFKEVR